jgi:hypothetical protein
VRASPPSRQPWGCSPETARDAAHADADPRNAGRLLRAARRRAVADAGPAGVSRRRPRPRGTRDGPARRHGGFARAHERKSVRTATASPAGQPVAVLVFFLGNFEDLRSGVSWARRSRASECT